MKLEIHRGTNMKFITDLSKGVLGQADPVELWEEIISHIPDEVFLKPGVKILSVASGHCTEAVVIAKRMLSLGISKEAVRESIWLIDKYNVFTNYAKLNYGFKNVVTADFLEWKTDMNFELITGNPPYQDSDDSGGTLWAKFAERAFDIAKDEGCVTLIHPPSFIGKHTVKAKGKSDYSCFANNQFKQIHLFDEQEKNKYFSGVGTRICWYIAQKQKPQYKTEIIGYDTGSKFSYTVNFNKITFLPTVINRLSMSIHEKLITCDSIKFIQKRELHYHTMKLRNQVSDTESDSFSNKSYFSHKIIRYSNFKFSDYYDIKLMIPQTSTIDKSFIDNNCNVSEDLFYILCKTKNEAKKLQTYLHSDLVKYIGKFYRPGRNLGALLSSNIIPNPECNINLTQEEIIYIENAIK